MAVTHTIVDTQRFKKNMGNHLATIDVGRKLVAVPLFFGGGGDGSPSNTMWPGLRPTFLPSDILIHPAVWPQQTWAEKWGWGAVSLWGTWVPI